MTTVVTRDMFLVTDIETYTNQRMAGVGGIMKRDTGHGAGFFARPVSVMTARGTQVIAGARLTPE